MSSSTRSPQIHLISKHDITIHHTLDLPRASSSSQRTPLAPSSLRLQSTLLSLTSTNLSYAARGHIFHWWDAYPVTHPSLPDLPSPYNQPGEWGIMPSWGFAQILESTVAGLQKGKFLYGFFPTMSAEFVLHIVKGEGDGLWREVSPGRKKLLTINNCYEEVDGRMDERRERGLEAVFRCLWVAGFVLSGHIFGGLRKGFWHPLGVKGEEQWGEERGDLRGAVVVSLAAGGKTGRALSDCLLFERGEGLGPKGYVAVTSSRETRVYVEGSKIPNKTVEYGDIGGQEVEKWVAALQPKKVVICDFGGRKGSYDALLKSLKRAVPDAGVLTIGIGIEPQVLSRDEDAAVSRSMAAYSDLYKINTSHVKDAIIAKFGTTEFMEASSRAWNGFLRRGNLDGINLEVDNGVKGIYRGWEKLINGEVKADTAMAFAL